MTEPANQDPKREERIKDLLSRMTLDEKIAQMTASTGTLRQLVMLPRYNLFTFDSGGKSRHGIPEKRFTDGPRGVTAGRSTCFPVAMARGAAWDVDLEERIGDAMGYEARAQGANYFGGVCINLVRHPGWGRAQESFGEDPLLLGRLGVAMIKGLQKHVMACAKHFACNSIEESRFFVDVQCDERTLREIYLPHFKMCVDAGVASIMSAYNTVRGRMCGHNRELLTGILKNEWGFDGFVISDFFWGVKNTEAAANAGLDIEMPYARHYGKKLKKAVVEGRVPLARIDEAVTRILRQKDRFAKVGLPAYDRAKVAGPEHAGLAREAARKGVVLLKNENRTLPLDRTKIKTIAVIGTPAKKAMLGDMGSSRVRPPSVVSLLDGITSLAGDSIRVIFEDGKDLDRARAAAKAADAVIVAAGLNWRIEGEYIPIPLFRMGGDRMSLDLPRGQEELIRRIAAQNPRCLVVLHGGSAITMESWKDAAPAIIMAWYPGMEGGRALAEIIFGDVNPSGKLPLVFPRSTEQLPFFDNRVRQIEYGYYHGCRLFDRDALEPAFAFGFGLSYTSYAYSNAGLDRVEIGKSGKVLVKVDVTNRGAMAGEEIVQMYVGYAGSEVDRPVKDLKGFARVALEPGEKKTVSLEIEARDLAYYDEASADWKIEEIEYEAMVGPSSRKQDLLSAGTFLVAGE